jgi:hypothetical protein
MMHEEDGNVSFEVKLPNKSTFIINMIIFAMSFILMFGAVKYSSYGLGIISVILNSITIKFKY